MDKGLVAAGDLVVGDEVYNLDGTTAVITDYALEKLDEPITVYNFEIDDFHTYFVGESSVLVHNMCGEGNGYKFKEDTDVDLTNQKGGINDALDEAFLRTGEDKSNFDVTKWARDENGKSFSVEWRSTTGAEVSVDIGHLTYGTPDSPHVGYQTGGKRNSGGAVRGHIFIDEVPYNRY